MRADSRCHGLTADESGIGRHWRLDHNTRKDDLLTGRLFLSSRWGLRELC